MAAITFTDGIALPSGSVSTFSGTISGTFVRQANVVQRDSTPYGISLRDLFVHDSASWAALPTTASADDLAFIASGTFSDPPTVQTIDFKATNTTAYATFEFTLPPGYQATETVAVRIRAHMNTTAADTSCNLDVEAHKGDGEGGAGSDICETSQQDLNAVGTTWTDFDFTITSTGLQEGDQLLVRIKISGTDSATGTAVIGEIGRVRMMLDIK